MSGGMRARERARTPDAQAAARRVLVDELAQHPDVFRYLAQQGEYREALVDELAQHPGVFRYLAQQASDLADDFPMGSRYYLTLRLFDQAAREIAGMLEYAEQVKAS